MFKNVFLSLSALVVFAISAPAQSIRVDDDVDSDLPPVVPKPYALSIGPKVGVNYSIAGNPDGLDLDLSGKAAFSAGIAANLRFARPAGKPYGTERLGVQLEALYAMHSLSTDAGSINMHCYEIPVLFQWYVIPTFAIEVGPTFKGAFSGSPEDFAYNNTVYQMNKVKAADIMLSVGVNYKVKSGFSAGLRYNLGNSDMAGNFKTKVSTMALSIGWLFSVIK